MNLNQYDQPIGKSLPGWKPARMPAAHLLAGRFCRLEPLDPIQHGMGLFEAHQQAADDRNWTYLPYEKPENPDAMQAHLKKIQASEGLVNFTVMGAAGNRPMGSVALMRIDCDMGSVEIGHVNWSPLMQRTPASTEAIFLLLRYVFDELGFRRCEWKCDSLNAPSRAAALRFGFEYEGRFKNAIVTKGRNRDTDWFGITDETWPRIREGFVSWLKDSNFDAQNRQLKRLQDFFQET